MKIAVVAANGRAGQNIVYEAYHRKHEVVAFGRGMNKTITSHYVRKDIFYITKSDLYDFDVVVDAFGVWIPDLFENYKYSIQHLCKLLKGSKTRLIVVGNSGGLYTDETHQELFYESSDFPHAFKQVAAAAYKAWDELKTHDDVQWTYIAPAADFQPEGPRMHKYIIAGEELTYNDKGESIISYGDYAIAVLDEIENADYIQDRISVLRA